MSGLNRDRDTKAFCFFFSKKKTLLASDGERLACRSSVSEVELSGTSARVALADQVKSQDWRARKATRKGRVSAAELAELRAKLIALIT